jgi:hypothetical protein
LFQRDKVLCFAQHASGRGLVAFEAAGSACLLLLQAGYFHSVGAFFAGFDVELNPVAFLNFMDEAGLVNEDFFLGIVGDDEAEAFGVVEEFNGAGKHVRG